MKTFHVIKNNCCAIFLIASTAVAQQTQTRILPVTAPLRQVVYDLSTGKALRSQAARSSSIDVVYDNTCLEKGYAIYVGLPTAEKTGGSAPAALIDHGLIPNANAQSNSHCSSGCRMDPYPIDAFGIAYCTTTGHPVDIELNFWNPPLGDCQNPYALGLSPSFSVSLSNLPRSSSPGVQACYVVNVVASANGQLGLDAEILGGASAFNGNFAWSIQMPGTTGDDGPVMAGSCPFGPPPGCDYCGGTVWEALLPLDSTGTGLGQSDEWVWETFGGLSGCESYGCVTPHHGLYLKLSSIHACPDLGTPFCDASDGSLAACPCSNPGAPNTGCDNAAATGGVEAEVTGLNTTGPSATVTGSGFPPTTSPTAILIRANNGEPSPVAFGDGIRCVGLQGLVRLAATLASGGASTHVFSHGAGPGTFHYQIWYRSNPASYCTPSAFNLSSGRSIAW